MGAAAVCSRIVEMLDSVAEQWFGLTFPPPQRAIDAAEWKPDLPEQYCRRCGDSIGIGEAGESGCGTCRAGAELSGGIAQGVVRLGPYVEPLRGWVQAIKYQRWNEMGEHLGQLLGRQLLDTALIEPDRTIVVPMPMPWQRRMYRGIDHARVIAQGAARVMNVPVVSILRKDLAPPQVILTPSARRRSGSRGLHIRRRLWGGWPLHDLQVVLVDDVRTTGATLKAASRLLRTLKPDKIICAVLAVSDSKARRDRNQLRLMIPDTKQAGSEAPTPPAAVVESKTVADHETATADAAPQQNRVERLAS